MPEIWQNWEVLAHPVYQNLSCRLVSAQAEACTERTALHHQDMCGLSTLLLKPKSVKVLTDAVRAQCLLAKNALKLLLFVDVRVL